MSTHQGMFSYLQWIDQQAVAHAVGLPRTDQIEATWQAILFRVGDQRMLVPLDQVRAIVPPPRQVRIPGAKNWVLGLANMRGELTGIFDLSLFYFDKPAEVSRQSVVLVAKHRGFGVAFLVDRSFGIRQVPFSAEREATESTLLGVDHVATLDEEEIPVLNLDELIENDRFHNAVA